MKNPKRARSSVTMSTVLFGIFEAGFVLVGVCALLAFLGKAHWVIDLLAHFRVQYMLFLSPACVIYFLLKRRKSAAFFLVCLLANSFVFVPYLFTGRATNSNSVSTRVMVFNVLTHNSQHGDVVSYIREQKPDIFVALETNQKWVDALARLLDEMPYSRSAPRADNFGIVIFSRIPFKNIDVTKYGKLGLPSVQASFSIGENRLSFVGTHPLPPIRRDAALERSVHLEQAASDLDPTASRVMVGDFNLSPWSPHFVDVLDTGDLVSASKGFGIQPTWYVFPTIFGGLKIDHILVSPDLNVHNYQIGPDLGSDHRAVVVDFQFEP